MNKATSEEVTSEATGEVTGEVSSTVSVVGPDGGETIRLGPATMRILEDGSTTGWRRCAGRG